MDEQKIIDVPLVRANLKILQIAFESDDNDMWSFGGTMVGNQLTDKYLPSVRVISREIGVDRLRIFIDFIDGSEMRFITLREKKFLQFIDFVEAYCGEYEKNISPDYQEAWNLLTALASLLDNVDQFSFSKEKIGGEIYVHLENTFRAFLYKIIAIAQLQDIVSDVLYDEKSDIRIKPYVICDIIELNELCDNLNVIEEFIRSMCNKIGKKHQFKFDIEELCTIEGPRTPMTIAKLIQHEAGVYVKNLE